MLWYPILLEEVVKQGDSENLLGRLFACKIPPNGLNEVDRLLSLIDNQAYLLKISRTYIVDYQKNFDKYSTAESLRSILLIEIYELRDRLVKFSSSDNTLRTSELFPFEPLHKSGGSQMKLKIYKGIKLRLYAIMLCENIYIFTGYGFKFLKAMQSQPDLRLELEKLRELELKIGQSSLTCQNITDGYRLI